MALDTALLSRIQFAFTISFHILFPALSIGLSTFLAIMEGTWLKTRNPVYLTIAKFWTKVFALTFGMGVVSGVVMEFQFGTNWGGFSRDVGNVLGALFIYEVMTAFFIEAGFLGVMLFGWNKVGPKLHYVATLCVTLGTTLSAFWILAANSWMQHPTGYSELNHVFSVKNWWDIIFNPINFPRFIHMLLAAYISATFVVISISALYLLKDKYNDFAKKCFSFCWYALLLLVPLQIFVGDTAGTNVHKFQPVKTAAIEGVWETQKGAPFLIFALPSQKLQKNYLEIPVPHAAALINTHEWNGELIGLKSVPLSDQPLVAPVFFSFRIMVYIGFFMFAITLLALYLRYKKILYHNRSFLQLSVLCAPLGLIALWCGWVTAEVGRQPWIVYDRLRTVDAASVVPLHDVMIGFILIVIVYGVIFGYFYFYFLNKMIKAGPKEISEAEVTDQPFQYMSAAASKEHNS